MLLLASSLGGCAYFYARPPVTVASSGAAQSDYMIGPGDALEVFVWQNPEVTTTQTVRPDGKISVPLLQDVEVVGHTPAELSSNISQALSHYIHDPHVTVILQSTAGRSETNIRVIGEAQTPRVIPYYANITLLDVMAEAGGLTQYADGNRAFLVRTDGAKHKRYHLRIGSLLNSGDLRANIQLEPGDTIIIPERWY